jgi:hypothetical protein
VGIKQKFYTIFTIMILIICAISFWLIEKNNSALINLEANRIANIVTTQILADRAVYTNGLVGKLEKEGTGASRDAHDRKGYIMLPAQFVRTVSKKVEKSSGSLYKYSLVSEWNLNKEQGLNDNFDHWAWRQLKEQDAEFSKNDSNTAFNWQSVSRVEEVDGKRVLKYMRADPASVQACVSCHNDYEQQSDILALRKNSNTEQGKIWKLHSLMGALKVEIPISSVELLASEARNELLLSILVLFLVGFLGLLFMISKNVIRPVEESINEVDRFKEIVSDVISKNGAILDGSDEEMVILDQENVDLKALQTCSMKNASNAQLAAAACGNLDDGFTKLNDKMQKMLGK